MENYGDCYLNGCYCNRDEAADEARAWGMLVRCGGGLPCVCSYLDEPNEDGNDTVADPLDTPAVPPNGTSGPVASTAPATASPAGSAGGSAGSAGSAPANAAAIGPTHGPSPGTSYTIATSMSAPAAASACPAHAAVNAPPAPAGAGTLNNHYFDNLSASANSSVGTIGTISLPINLSGHAQQDLAVNADAGYLGDLFFPSPDVAPSPAASAVTPATLLDGLHNTTLNSPQRQPLHHQLLHHPHPQHQLHLQHQQLHTERQQQLQHHAEPLLQRQSHTNPLPRPQHLIYNQTLPPVLPPVHHAQQPTEHHYVERNELLLKMPAQAVLKRSRCRCGTSENDSFAEPLTPSKRSRCECPGSEGGVCACDNNCKCVEAAVERAGRAIMELATLRTTHGGSGCCAHSAHASHGETRISRVLQLKHSDLSAVSGAPKPTLGSCSSSTPVSVSKPAVHPSIVGDILAASAKHSCCCRAKSRDNQMENVQPKVSGAGSCSASLTNRSTSSDGSPRSRKKSDGKERPFQCSLCNASFLFKQNRDRHIIEVHEGNRPFHCTHPGCNSAFKNSSGLKQHETTVHMKARPFKCDMCSSSFGQRNHLTQHVAAVHEQKRPFTCASCGSSFSNRGNLNQHMKRRHPDTPIPEGEST